VASVRPPQFAPPRTLRGFLIRVATIAVAALIVLAAMDIFEYLHDNHPTRTYHPEPAIAPHDDVP
jgi:hypothetical protein